MIKDFAGRISEIRRSLKLTQSQFAELVHLSEDSIGKIERGGSLPTLDTLGKIADGLKMPLMDLLEERAPKKIQNKALDDLVRYLRTKSQGDINLIHQIAVLVLERKV